jgi:phospholipid N-methyltransferase
LFAALRAVQVVVTGLPVRFFPFVNALEVVEEIHGRMERLKQRFLLQEKT